MFYISFIIKNYYFEIKISTLNRSAPIVKNCTLEKRPLLLTKIAKILNLSVSLYFKTSLLNKKIEFFNKCRAK